MPCKIESSLDMMNVAASAVPAVMDLHLISQTVKRQDFLGREIAGSMNHMITNVSVSLQNIPSRLGILIIFL